MTALSKKPDKRILLLLLLVVMLALTSPAAEASVKGSFKSAWGNMKNYAISGAFWINAIIIFGVIFVLYSVFFGKKTGSDKTTKVVIIIVLFIVAMALASKIIGNDGRPAYIWKAENFRKGVQFAVGPPDSGKMPACVSEEHSLFKSITSPLLDPNPPCCGDGAYEVQRGDTRVCQQAILRMNENGSGIIAFVLASLLFFLLFKALGKRLGFASMSGRTGTWFPIILSVVLGALMANSRVTKNNIVMIGGWVAVILIGSKLNKSLSGDKKKQMKGLGYGLAFALVQLIANMLGSSLWGGVYDPSELGIGTILWNMLIGIGIGYVWSIVTHKESFARQWLSKMGEDRKKDVKAYIDNKQWGKAIGRWFPLTGWSFKRDRRAARASRQELMENLADQRRELERIRSAQAQPQRADALQLWMQKEDEVINQIRRLEEEQRNISRAGSINREAA